MNKILSTIKKAKFPVTFYEWMLAKRYLKGRAKDKFFSVITWFSLLGIAIGVAVLIIVMSVMNGFRAEMLSNILGINGHVMVYSATGRSFDNYEQVINTIKSDDVLKKDVTFVMPLTEGQVMFAHEGRSKGGLVRGIKATDLKQYTLLDKNIYGVDFASIKDNEIIIGDKLAFSLGVRIGDEVTITSANGNITAFGVVPRIRSYRVAGTFSVGMYQYDSSFVFMKLDASQLYLNMEGAVSHVEIFTNNPDNARAVKNRVANMLGPDYRVLDWQDLNSSFFGALKVEQNVMFLILTLIILIAAFNIVSGLVMLVKDKGKDIAILRTVGMSKNSVMKVFMCAGFYIGLMGTFFGTLFGLLICYNIGAIQKAMNYITGVDLFAAEVYFLSQLPAEVHIIEVIWIVVMALSISLIASYYPARRASKLDPVEALRNE